MIKTQIMLLFGGESSEHDVSIISAHNVYAAIDDTRYNVTLCYIDKVGRWWLTESIEGAHIGHPQLMPVLGHKRFVYIEGNEQKVVKPDVIFPVLHGSNGEDGTVQGLARLIHVPCVGPGLIDAAITMNKDVTKRILRDAGIPVVPWVLVKRGENTRFRSVADNLGPTVFVKPANAGSSVGVHKVTTSSGFHDALLDAWHYDPIAVVEKAIAAREIEVAVLGNDHLKVSGLGEIVPGDAFYSYDDKYAMSSTARVELPALVDELLAERIRDYAVQAYRAVKGRGMARIDFFIDKNSGEVYLNEINSIPGFTNISMYPKLWHAAGVSYAQLIDELILLALEK